MRVSAASIRRFLVSLYSNRCQNCGNIFPAKTLRTNLIVPAASGGKNELDNYTLSCAPCAEQRSGQPLPPEQETLLKALAVKKAADIRRYLERRFQRRLSMREQRTVRFHALQSDTVLEALPAGGHLILNPDHLTELGCRLYLDLRAYAQTSRPKDGALVLPHRLLSDLARAYNVMPEQCVDEIWTLCRLRVQDQNGEKSLAGGFSWWTAPGGHLECELKLEPVDAGLSEFLKDFCGGVRPSEPLAGKYAVWKWDTLQAVRTRDSFLAIPERLVS